VTICIAAICNGGDCVVAACDKMITYTSPPYHQFEHPKPKIHKVAGSALLPSEFIRELKTSLKNLSTTIQTVN